MCHPGTAPTPLDRPALDAPLHLPMPGGNCATVLGTKSDEGNYGHAIHENHFESRRISIYIYIHIFKYLYTYEIHVYMYVCMPVCMNV